MTRRGLFGLCAVAAGAQSLSARQPFSFVAVKWAPGGDPQARIRVSRDGVRWGEWREIHGDAHAGAAQLLAFDEGQRYAQVESRVALECDFFAADGPVARRPLSLGDAGAVTDRPAMVSRLEWGSPDGNNQRGTPSYAPVQHLVVHHTADGPVADAAAWVRAIWRFHVMTNGWADIGYNFLVAPDGTIFEGRAGGDNVIGAHFSCQNTGTMGVALLGDFTRAAPTRAALDALVRLLAWRASVLKIDPQGVTRHNGMRQDLYQICSHRDGNTAPGSCTVTACPGDRLYPLLEKLRNDVNALVTGRWHWTASPGSLWRPEDGGVWRYGSERTESYDTGARNEGWVESSPFAVDGRLRLTYESWYQTEDTGRERDQKLLEMSVDNGEWFVIDQVDGEMETWTRRSVDLAVTGSVRLRFRFDSVDEYRNGYAGWRVRDVYRVPEEASLAAASV